MLPSKKIDMKKTLLVVLIFFVVAFSASAQRYAVIDTKYILDKLPEYRDADKKLQQVSTQWQKEIDDKQAELDRMYKNYDAEQFMLSDDLKKKRETELFNKEKEVREPIQDKVYDAIQKIALAKAYDFVLDKSEGITVIFADPKLDKSDEVLKELGIK
jgi:outer membrane protein